MNSLIFIGQDEKTTESIAKEFADKNDLYFANAQEIMEYELVNSYNDIKNTCGEEYLKSLRRKIVKSMSEYENSVIYLPTYLYMEDDFSTILKTLTKIHLNFKKRKSFINYDLRKLFLSKNCNLTINIYSKEDKNIEHINEKVLKFLK